MAAPDAGTFDHFQYEELPATAASEDSGTGDFFQYGELPFVFHPVLVVAAVGKIIIQNAA